MPKARDENSPAKKRVAEYRLAADYRSYYTNSAGVQTTPWDITIKFGKVIEASKAKLVVENQAEVVMSPQHAKSVAQLMDEQIKSYEAKHGPIPDIKAKKTS